MILREYYELCEGGLCKDLLTEEEKIYVENGGLILSGVMQRANTQNGNGRVYPMPILEREIKLYKNLVKESRALGELDHPESSIINLNNCSHLVTDIWFEGEDVLGKVKVLNTPSGQILRSLVEGGVKLGISSRGLGTVQEGPSGVTVNDDFQLVCFDFVSEPSTAGAFMMKENKDPNIWNKADKISRLLNDILSE
jgi:hypothetical protein